MEKQFITFCVNNDINNIKKLINTCKIQNATIKYEFIRACCYGHIYIIKYLINLYKMNTNYNIIDIHDMYDYGFRLARMNGYNQTVKYLISIGDYLNYYYPTCILFL